MAKKEAGAEAFKASKDVTLHRVIREAGELADGTKVYEKEGVNYPAGSYVFASNLSPRDKEKVANGEFDGVLEPVALDEAVAWAKNVDAPKGVFIPEHEAERVALVDYGHKVVDKEQVLELASAGADGAKKALEEAKESGSDQRDLPRFEADQVPDQEVVGVEQPPGVPVGEVLKNAKES